MFHSRGRVLHSMRTLGCHNRSTWAQAVPRLARHLVGTRSSSTLSHASVSSIVTRLEHWLVVTGGLLSCTLFNSLRVHKGSRIGWRRLEAVCPSPGVRAPVRVFFFSSFVLYDRFAIVNFRTMLRFSAGCQLFHLKVHLECVNSPCMDCSYR